MIVVDQSVRPTVPEIEGLDIVHHPTGERGVALARNRGLALASSEIVAFVDDDCTVGPSWINDIVLAFERHPDAGIVFGSVVASRRSPETYVPDYTVVRERRLKGRWSARTAHGISAAVYIRARAAERIGPFDTRLGPGAEFQASEDWDYTFRALAAGLIVIETPAIVVEHHGARSYSDGSAARLLRRNAFSHGAIHAKLLRCFDAVALVLIASELVELVRLVRPHHAFVHRPTNAARLLMYCRGFAAGLRAPVRRTMRLFAEPAPTIAVPGAPPITGVAAVQPVERSLGPQR